MAARKLSSSSSSAGGVTMKPLTNLISIKQQQGLSIVELMVTLVLSLFIVLITTGFYVNNKSTYRYIDSSEEVQENGRYAIHFLRETIANAGFPKVDLSIIAFSTVPTNDSGPNNSDQISVSYQATQNCLGANIAGPITSTFAIVGTNLSCNGTALIAGVENLQLEYGVDNDGDEIPNTYQTADAVTDFNQVVAVRLAVLISSQNQVRDQASAETYQLLGVSYTAPNDRLHRRVFTTTIPLRNNNKDT